jgi:uncharacterized protein YbcI
MPSDRGAHEIPELTRASSGAILALYCTVYGQDRTTARTYMNDNVLVCVPENILTEHENHLIAGGAGCEVIDARSAFQSDGEDEFTAAVERLTHRNVVAFSSADQTSSGLACELFFLGTTPPTTVSGAGP